MKKESVTAALVALSVLSSWFLLGISEIKAIPSTVGAALIDIYTQKEPSSGRGLNQSSDAFAPEERVILYANVTYNLSPLEGHTVTFEINGPPNPINNLVIIATPITNATGIAKVNFTIPWPSENPETIVFGVWGAHASVNVAGQIIMDNLTFRVGWIIEIISLKTLGTNLQPKIKFMRGTNLIAALTLTNIVMKPKNATLVVSAIDFLGHLLGTVVVNNFEINPGENCTYVTLKIPEWAKVGDAKIYANANTALPSMGGVSYCPEVSTTFRITLLCDLNGDGVVDIKDIATAARAFGTYPGHSRWNPAVDVNQDDKIDIKDLVLIAKNFGKTDP